MKIKLLLLFVAAILVSCSSDELQEEKLPMYNFGSNTYKEPFQGLFKSQPEILIKSLEYPPYSWVRLDTTVLTKRFEIAFNEEAIRSKSMATLNFVDTMYRHSEHITIEFNGTNIAKGYKILADSATKVINVKCTISPALKDTLFMGYITATGIELDEINNTNLQYDNNVLATWEFQQEIKSPLWLWFLWIVSGIILAIIVILVLILIIKLLILLASFIGTLWTQLASALSGVGATPNRTNQHQQDKSKKSDDKQKDNNKDKFPLQMIDIDKKETKCPWKAVVIILENNSVEWWYLLNLKKINKRRERWRLPFYEELINKHKGQKVQCKEELLLLIGWDLKDHPELYSNICPQTLQVIDKIIESSKGDVETILRTYEEFIYSVDKQAALLHPKALLLHWIDRDQWLEYLEIEALKYIDDKQEETITK